MTLPLGKFDLGLDSQSQRYERMVQKALDKLKKKGVTLSVKPGHEPPAHPGDIANLPDDFVRNLYSRASGWASYLRGQETYHRLLEEAYAREANNIELSIRLVSDGETIKDREDEAKVHPRVQELRTDTFSEHSTSKLLGARAGELESIAKVCSRDSTYRTMEKEQIVRDGNLPMKRKRPPRVLRNL